MIFVDSDIFVRDLRYPRDKLQITNSRFLNAMKERPFRACTSLFNILEVCGILSFNLSEVDLKNLYTEFAAHYGLKVLFPVNAQGHFDYDIPQIFLKITTKQSLCDAQISYVVERFAKKIKTFITWNAAHFSGKLPIPVLTPREFLEQKTRPF